MAKQNNQKSILNYLLLGLVAICVVLLLTQIFIDTRAELQSKRSRESFAIFLPEEVGAQDILTIPTPTPFSQQTTPSAESTDEPYDQYFDTGE